MEFGTCLPGPLGGLRGLGPGPFRGPPIRAPFWNFLDASFRPPWAFSGLPRALLVMYLSSACELIRQNRQATWEIHDDVTYNFYLSCREV